MQTKFALSAIFQATLAGIVLAQLRQDCTRTYVVQDGDYCNKISAEENASTYQLAQINAGEVNADCTNLAIGQTICLGTTTSDCTTNYVVEIGDICEDVASSFNITTAALLLNNPNINSGCTNIYPGEVLCVAPIGGATSTIAATPIPSTSVRPTSTSISNSTTTFLGNSTSTVSGIHNATSTSILLTSTVTATSIPIISSTLASATTRVTTTGNVNTSPITTSIVTSTAFTTVAPSSSV